MKRRPAWSWAGCILLSAGGTTVGVAWALPYDSTSVPRLIIGLTLETLGAFLVLVAK